VAGAVDHAGFVEVADAQIEAMMKTHALTGQCFVVTASNPVDQGCLDWLERELGPQDKVGVAGGWSAVIHPFANFLGGPHTGLEERLVVGDLDLEQITAVKV
jgi:nitrilase